MIVDEAIVLKEPKLRSVCHWEKVVGHPESPSGDPPKCVKCGKETGVFAVIPYENYIWMIKFLSLEKLIERLGTGTGNSMFELNGSFIYDFGWQATWRETISMEPPKQEITKGWGQTPQEAVIKLILKLVEKDIKKFGYLCPF